MKNRTDKIFEWIEIRYKAFILGMFIGGIIGIFIYDLVLRGFFK